jgi:tRNA-specific 2-thiouridylase
VCTGHYADVLTGPDGQPELHRAAAWAKDQSYVLGVLTAEQIAHSYFPLGSTPSKAEVRAEAAARGIQVAQKPDSHDICFIPDGDTRGWLADRVGAEPGDILDGRGEVIGTHAGAAAFTVGQRKGLAIGTPAADGRPRFVLEIRPKDNTVVVGPQEALAIREIAGSAFTWAGTPPTRPDQPFDCDVQIRAHADPVPARAAVSVVDGRVELVITPREHLSGVAPGQTAVVYAGTRVLGQVTIDRTVSAVDHARPPARSALVGAAAGE